MLSGTLPVASDRPPAASGEPPVERRSPLDSVRAIGLVPVRRVEKAQEVGAEQLVAWVPPGRSGLLLQWSSRNLADQELPI